MKIFWTAVVIAGLSATAWAEEAAAPQGLVLDDFEGEAASVSADKAERHSGAQSLKIDYDTASGVLFWTAVPRGIAWENYGAIGFWMKGTGSGVPIALDIADKTGETYRFMFKDDGREWRQVLCPFASFVLREEGQPAGSDKNGTLDFPVTVIRFEPVAAGRGTVYIDDVSLEPLN